MNKIIKVILYLCLFVIFLFLLFFGFNLYYTYLLHSRHKPKLIKKNNLTQENPYLITEPEISLALYGELKGEPHYYLIDPVKDFDLYVGILTLKNEMDKEPKYKVYFEIFDYETKEKIEFSKPTGIVEDHIWTPWFEPYGKKWYWVGPEIGEKFKSSEELKNYPKGKYLIKVYNQENKGTYSLAVGDQEKFTIWDWIKIFFTLPSINKLWKKK